MNNRKLTVLGEGLEDFKLAMRLAMSDHEKIVGYALLNDNKTLAIYWMHSQNDKFVRLPYEMDVDEATVFIWGWLQKTGPDTYPPKPDQDGNNKKGFLVTDLSCHPDWTAIVAIRPIWAEHGI